VPKGRPTLAPAFSRPFGTGDGQGGLTQRWNAGLLSDVPPGQGLGAGAGLWVRRQIL